MIRQSNSFIDGNSVIIDMAGADVQSFYADTSGVTIKNLTIKNWICIHFLWCGSLV